MFKQIIACCLFSFIQVFAQAQSLKSGFEALLVYDFFKAKQIFTTKLKKEPAASNYGLALIHVDHLNHFYSLDSAFHRITKAEQAFRILDSTKQLKYRVYSLSDSAIQYIKSGIYSNAFAYAQKVNSPEYFQYYIDYYLGSPMKDAATRLRNQCAFQRADSLNSSIGWEFFLSKYPDSEQAKQAAIKLDDSQYREETSSQTLGDFEKFLVNRPLSKHKQDAEDAIYSLSVTKIALEDLYAFSKKYPDNRNTNQVWDQLYDLFTSDQRKESFSTFKENYPEYPFQDRIQYDFQLSGTRLFPIVHNDLWGYADSTGRVVIPFQFEEAEDFSENLALVRIHDKIAYINKSGIRLVQPNWNDGETFSNGLAIVEKDDKYGIINTRGELILSNIYSNIIGPQTGNYSFEKDSLWGFLNQKARIIVEPIFQEVHMFSEGLAAVKRDGKFGFIDSAGHEIIPFKFDEVGDFKDGVANVMIDDLYGLIARNGTLILPVKYNRIGSFKNGLCRIMLNDKCGYINKEGKIIIPLQGNCATAIQGVDGFNEGLARIDKKGKKGFIDKKGKVVIAPTLQDCGYFSEGLASFKKNNKWGFISKNGKVFIDPIFEEVLPFHEGFSRVKKGGKYGLVNRDGRIVLPIKYIDIIDEGKGLFIITLASGKLLLNGALEEITESAFDEIKKTNSSGILRLMKAGKMYLFHSETEKIFWVEAGVKPGD